MAFNRGGHHRQPQSNAQVNFPVTIRRRIVIVSLSDLDQAVDVATEDNKTVQIWKRSDGKSQQWYYVNGYLESVVTGHNLSLTDNDISKRVRAEPAGKMTWKLYSDGTIRPDQYFGMLLTATKAENGGELRLIKSEAPGPHQRWKAISLDG